MSESKKRKMHSAEFKAKVGMETVRGVKTINGIGQANGDNSETLENKKADFRRLFCFCLHLPFRG